MTTLSVRVTEEASRPLGHALITVTGLPTALQTVEFAFSRHGYPANHLGLNGWQGAECWLQPEEAWHSDGALKFVLGPELLYQLESMPYTLTLRGQGMSGESRVTFTWPLELEPETTTGTERVAVGGTKVHPATTPPRESPPPVPDLPHLGPADISIPSLGLPASAPEPVLPPLPVTPPPLPVMPPPLPPPATAASVTPVAPPPVPPPTAVPTLAEPPPQPSRVAAVPAWDEETVTLLTRPPILPPSAATPTTAAVPPASATNRTILWVGLVALLGLLAAAGLVWRLWSKPAVPVVTVPAPATVPTPATAPLRTPPTVSAPAPATQPAAPLPSSPPATALPPAAPPLPARPPVSSPVSPPPVSPPPTASQPPPPVVPAVPAPAVPAPAVPVPATPTPSAPPATTTPPARPVPPSSTTARPRAGGDLEKELKSQFESKPPADLNLEKELESRLKKPSSDSNPTEKKQP